MTQEKMTIFRKILFYGYVIGIVIILTGIALGFVYYLAISLIEDTERTNYCNEVYPAQVKSINDIELTVWNKGNAVMEKGFVKCCRYNYVEHERIEECKIFEYKEE